MSAAKNAPLFIEALYDACQSFAGNDPDLFAPDVTMIKRGAREAPDGV
jgi:hypothetical protein